MSKEDTTDPYGDRDNIPRAFPSSEDALGTPDSQPNQPAEALGEGQVSIESIQAADEQAAQSSAKKPATKSESAS